MNANPLNYDAKYPQTADNSVNDKAKIEIMEKNIGRQVMFQLQDQQFNGKIVGVPNSEHYSVLVGESWDWYVREEAVHFIENIY
ncbi:MAG: hypothetical protein ACOYNN_13390 [Terrimicrobiaceae bacterium]